HCLRPRLARPVCPSPARPLHRHPPSLHDALPLCPFWAEPASPATTTEAASAVSAVTKSVTRVRVALSSLASGLGCVSSARETQPDGKSTRLNSSHASTSYAVSCLKRKATGTPRRR